MECFDIGQKRIEASNTSAPAALPRLRVAVQTNNLIYVKVECSIRRLGSQWFECEAGRSGGLMTKLFRATRVAAEDLAAVLTLGSATSPSYADTGTVRMRITKAGFVFGAGGGTGTLKRGKSERCRRSD
jgi:hypothetical protein